MTKLIELSLLLSHKKQFISILSAHYPIPENLLTKYEDLWDWELLSRNTAIDWTENLIRNFEKQWTWKWLSYNPLPWSATFIQRYAHRWNWYVLGQQTAIVNDPKMLEICLWHWNDWDQEHLFKEYMPTIEEKNREWAELLFEKHANLKWNYLSYYDRFPWTPVFIKKYKDKWDWKVLSCNKGLPWTEHFIKEYEDQWDWKMLSRNECLPWRKDFIEYFKNYWDWDGLCINKGIVWDISLIDYFKDNIQWVYLKADSLDVEFWVDGLINGNNITWTVALYKKYNNQIDTQFKEIAAANEANFYYESDDKYWTYYLNKLNWSYGFLHYLLKEEEINYTKFIDTHDLYYKYNSDFWQHIDKDDILNNYLKDAVYNHEFPWNDAYIEEFNKRFLYETHKNYWHALSYHKAVSLNEHILQKFELQWDWDELSKREDLSEPLIEKFFHHWNWDTLFTNPAITEELIYKYRDQWRWGFSEYNYTVKEKFPIQSYVNDFLLEEVLAATK